MSSDHDLSALMPEPPPPRPARREAALAEALRRFDGKGAAPAPRPSAPPAPPRRGWGRPQIALLASAVLVVLISTPIWWAERDRILPAAPAPAPPVVQAQGDAVSAPAASPPSPTADLAPAAPPAATPAERAASPAPATIETNLNRLPQFVPAPARPGPAPADDSATGESQLLRPPPPPPAPASEAAREASPRSAPAPVAQRARQAAAETAAEDEAGYAITVTGSRIERSDYESRTPIVSVADAAPLDGEWNACTLDDPRRNPTVCRASPRVSEGLALAWQGDLDRAIRAFDRAIAAEPGLALAYLNRGLAWQAKGDLGRALSDLNRAVARDRTGARGYYHRSRLYRARGDTARADADAERAIELDPDYAAVLP